MRTIDGGTDVVKMQSMQDDGISDFDREEPTKELAHPRETLAEIHAAWRAEIASRDACNQEVVS